jgi:hypothetical protein
MQVAAAMSTNTNALSPKIKKAGVDPFGACFFFVQLTRGTSTFATQRRAIFDSSTTAQPTPATNSKQLFPSE